MIRYRASTFQIGERHEQRPESKKEQEKEVKVTVKDNWE